MAAQVQQIANEPDERPEGEAGVDWALRRLQGGVADELKGLDVNGGIEALSYARDLLQEWLQEASQAIEGAANSHDEDWPDDWPVLW